MAAIAPTSRVADMVRDQAGTKRNAEQGSDCDITGHGASCHDHQQGDHWHREAQLRCEDVHEHDDQAVIHE
jgi:hypothetical protein